MNRLRSFWHKLRLRNILAVFFAGMLLIISTACSPVTSQGANPNNPAVQAGGGNNPYKNGGDKYTNYRMSTEATETRVDTTKGKKQANLPLNSQELIATIDKKSEILYPGAETPEGRALKEAEMPIKTSKDYVEPQPGGLNQRNPDLGERIQNRLELVKDSFQESSEFLREKADEASARPETQPKPAVRK
jgi:hypothetical protein